MEIKKDADLGFLGETYQYKLVHEFMADKDFFCSLHGAIEQNKFTDPLLRVFVGILKEYYEETDIHPSYDMMEVLLRDKAYNDIQRQEYIALVEKVKETPSDGAEYVQNRAKSFFKQQRILLLTSQIQKLIGNGQTDKCEEVINILNEAINIGEPNDMGSGVFDDIGDTLSDDYRKPIPTGIDAIDETLEGGLGKQELGVIIGPSSFGKTSMTTAIAGHAASCGFKVLQIVFEDREKQIKRKHIARITNIESKDLSKDSYITMVKEQVSHYREHYPLLDKNLRIVKFQSGEKTALDIERYIKKQINSGFRPDMVIVDYFECLEHVGDAKDEWGREGKTMRKFEAMAGELDIAMWIPLQGTKDSVNAELVTMDKAGGSFKKIQVAHIVMSIARTIEDIEDNKATIAILKNRAGKAGKVFDGVEFNNGTCRISCDNVSVVDSLSQWDKEKQVKKQNFAENLAKKVFSDI